MPPLDDSTLAKLRCPKSAAKLLPAPPQLLARLHADDGFVSASGEWFYPVEEGFPVLTADAAVDIASLHLDWDATYRAGQTPWDKGAPAPPLTEFFESGGSFSGRILVPGCGRGHDARTLARCPGTNVTALDISPTAIADAKSIASAEGAHGVDFVVADLFDLPTEFAGTFDWVVEHTCLSGLHPTLRPRYFEAVTSALKPGGHLFAIWFTNPDLDPGESGPPFAISKGEIEIFTAGKFTLVREWVPAKAFEGRESRELVQILTKI